MEEDEYKQFLGYVYQRYVQNHHSHAGELIDGPMGRHWNYEFERLKKAVRFLRHAEEFEDYSNVNLPSFTPEALQKALEDIAQGTHFNNYILKESGFMDALNAHYPELVEGLELKYLPVQEVELLRAFGSENPEVELAGFIYSLKKRERKRDGYYNESSVEQRLNRVEEQVREARNEAKQPPKGLPEGKKPRRWFKGLGNIGQGSALSICNVALAFGAIHFPVSAETQTWGAVASVTTGVGMIFTGIGEFTGE